MKYSIKVPIIDKIADAVNMEMYILSEGLVAFIDFKKNGNPTIIKINAQIKR